MGLKLQICPSTLKLHFRELLFPLQLRCKTATVYMASLRNPAPAFHSIETHRRPSAGVHAPSLIFITSGRHYFQAHLNLRFRKEERVHAKKRWGLIFASNTNPSEESNESKISDAAPKGPPFLTILAGFLVLLVICWFVGSIAKWLIGLIVNPPPLT